MCGIAGFSLTEQDLAEAPLVPRWLAVGLTLAIENRGKDATGFAYVDKDKNGKATVYYNKRGITASKFVKKGYLDQIADDAQTVILHTRAGTGGSEKDNRNNHPIVTEGVTGIHNGILSNDSHLFRTKGWPRVGNVDSEILFKFIEQEGLRTMVKEVEGDAAIAWLRHNNDPTVLNLANLGGRPLVVGYTCNGGLVFASTKQAIEDGSELAELDIKKIEEIKDGYALAVREGTIIKAPWHVGELQDSWKYQTGYVSTYGNRPMYSVCKVCHESSCICEFQAGLLAPYPEKPDEEDKTHDGRLSWVEADDKAPTLNGGYQTGRYRVGPWMAPYTAWKKWKDATLALRREAEAQAKGEEPLESWLDSTTISNGQIKQLLEKRPDRNDHSFVLTLEEDSNDEWQQLLSIKAPFQLYVRTGKNNYYVYDTECGAISLLENGLDDAPESRFTVVTVKAVVSTMDDYQWDAGRQAWLVNMNVSATECKLVRDGDLYLRTRGTGKTGSQDNDVYMMDGVPSWLGTEDRVARVMQEMIDNVTEEEVTAEILPFGKSEEVYAIEWTDDLYSVVFRATGGTDYIEHYDESDTVIDWSPLVDQTIDEVVAALEYCPTWIKTIDLTDKGTN
jgi:hypothetical protein